MPDTYQRLLERQRSEVTDGLFASTRRLRYPKERLRNERQRRLRNLLATAANRPFYQKRFADAGINPDTATETDLARIQPLTKPEMMAQFNSIIDPALTLDDVEAHLAEMDTNDNYLHNQYRAIATGGSSGVRGVFVYGWTDWVELILLQMRWNIRRPALTGMIGSTFPRKPAHISGVLHAFLAGGDIPMCQVPATMPLHEAVAALNAAQPVRLQGYPTSIRLLVGEQEAGRLDIHPSTISTCGELLTEDIRHAARRTWGIGIDDIWGCTEGVYAYPCDAGAGMHLPDDVAIIEPVDTQGNPVSPGQPAAKIYLTNLYNTTQPLIRYELTDAMTLLDNECPCGCAHRRITNLRGRLDDVFVYPGGVVVHPVGFEAVLLNAPQITEYQVIQTSHGVDVKVRADTEVGSESLRSELSTMMSEAGLPDPQVSVARVDSLDRLWSGKLRRFAPLNTGK